MVLDSILSSPRLRSPSFRRQFTKDGLGSWSTLYQRHRFLLSALVLLTILCTVYLYFAVTFSGNGSCSGLTGAQKASCHMDLVKDSIAKVMELSPSNVAMLSSATNFLQVKLECDSLGKKSHIENFLEGIPFWTWYELIEALKHSQDSFSSNSYSTILDKIVDNLIERLASPFITSPYNTSSSNRSSFQLSCDSSSNNSWRNNSSSATWWFEHLLFLNIDLLDKIIRTMILHDFDHGIVSKFLFQYHTNLCCLGASQKYCAGEEAGKNNLEIVDTPDKVDSDITVVKSGASQIEKIESTKVVINLLSLLDMRSISCKDLFNFNRVAISLKVSRYCRNKIESLMGCLLDQATIDYLLVPSPHEKDHAYDVDFALRLVHIFVLGESYELTLNQVKRVAKMMDLFLGEVAPDPHLKPSEFEALISVLPDTARESHDQLYLAMDMYLKVHAGIGEKEKMSICCLLKHGKLSPELQRHLTRNLVFPLETKPKAHVTRQSRMKTLLQENEHLKNFFDSMFLKSFKNLNVKEDVELPSVKKSGIHIMSNATNLPKLCS